MKRSKSDVTKPAVRFLKEGACRSLSGKSTLTYRVGCTADSEVHLRVADNTGGGFFSDEWVALSAIQEAFDRQPQGKPIVSLMLYPLFQGRSLNTPAFLLAVLKAEGLVKQLGDKQRGYERVDPAEFMAGIKKLTNSSIDLNVEEDKSAEASSQPAKRGKKPSKFTPESTTTSAS